MKGKLRILSFLAVLASLGISGYGCGSGSGDENLSSAQTVVGTVEASKVAGARVCVNGTENCVTTNSNGIFRINVNKLPATLIIKVGEAPLGEVNATSTFVPVTPISLAEGNPALANKIAAFIHAVGNDTSGEAEVVNLSKVEIELDESRPLVDLLAKQPTVTVTVKKKTEDGEEIEDTIELENDTIKIGDKPVKYSMNLAKFTLWQFEEWVSKATGRSVLITPVGVTCRLIVNPNDPSKFKYVDCSNSTWNDETWEKISGGDYVKVVDEDGNIFRIQEADESHACYRVIVDNNTLGVGRNSTLCAYVGKEDAYSELAKIVATFQEYNGKRVYIRDFTENETVACTAVVNSRNPLEVALINCDDPEYNDCSWERLRVKDGKVFAEGETQLEVVNATAIRYRDEEGTGVIEFTNVNGNSSWDDNMCVEETSPEPEDFSWFIHGKVITNSAITENWKVRITPEIEQVEGKWGGIVCKISENGEFGDKCVMHGYAGDFTNDTVYQIAVFEDENDDYHFNPDEHIICIKENLPYGSWENFNVDDCASETGESAEISSSGEKPLDKVLRFVTENSGNTVYITHEGGTESCTLEALTDKDNIVIGYKLLNCSDSSWDSNGTFKEEKDRIIIVEADNATDIVKYVSNSIMAVGPEDDEGDVVITSDSPETVNASELNNKYVAVYDYTAGLNNFRPELCMFLNGNEIDLVDSDGTQKMANFTVGGNTIYFSNSTTEKFDITSAEIVGTNGTVYYSFEIYKNDTPMFKIYKPVDKSSCVKINDNQE